MLDSVLHVHAKQMNLCFAVQHTRHRSKYVFCCKPLNPMARKPLNPMLESPVSTPYARCTPPRYNLPTSTSQCIIGAVVGVGLAEGLVGINWRFFAKQFMAWVATLFLVALCTGALFAQV